MTLNMCAHKITDRSYYNLNQIAKLMLGSLMKKIQNLTAKDLYFVVDSMTVLYKENSHYYELVTVEIIKYLNKFNLKDLARLIECLNIGKVHSKPLIYALNKRIMNLLLPQVSLIYGLMGESNVKLNGLLPKNESMMVNEDDLKSELFPSSLLPKPAKGAQNMNSLYTETGNEIYKLETMVTLTLGLVNLSKSADCTSIDDNIWNLLIHQLQSHINYHMKFDSPISEVHYSSLCEISSYISSHYPTLKVLNLPRNLQVGVNNA